MRLDWVNGTPLYCRRCDAVVPHRVHHRRADLLWDEAGHTQSGHNAMISLSVADDVDPAVVLLPLRDWTEPYVQRRYQLLSTWASKT